VPYRYSELDGDRFQQLSQALVVASYPDAVSLPVGQADGGRDAFALERSGEAIVFQAKWTGRSVSDPVTWLQAEIRGESDKIRRLVARGMSRYIILTNVPATARPDTGTLDRLRRALDDLSDVYNVDIQCWWRDDLDRRLDVAGDGIKFSFSEILVGLDAYRAVLDDILHGDRMQRIIRIVRTASATQWERDAHVRFKQLGRREQALEDVFVDVEALNTSARSPLSYASSRVQPEQMSQPATWLLMSPRRQAVMDDQPRKARRFTILGAPGQGKSTLLQLLCQVQRANLLLRHDFARTVGVGIRPGSERVAIRADLRDFSIWLSGRDPFESDATGEYVKLSTGTTRTLEGFVARMLVEDTGGLAVSADDLHDICQRFPVLLALDGLDEVADATLRTRTVAEVEAALVRIESTAVDLQCAITARPSFSSLAEPDRSLYTYLELTPLSGDLQRSFLQKWAKANGLSGSEARKLRQLFEERRRTASITELATNPMQLAILLHLMHQQGPSVPTHRTALFEDYVKLFLAREADKDATVARHRAEIEDLTQYLGWYLQSEAEAESSNGRASLSHLHRVLKHYRTDKDEDPKLVPRLFTAMTDRVWVLTSASQGSFEFDVQPLREWFAAQHITSESPPYDRESPDIHERFIELAIRPYWANTARFMAGMFRKGERPGVVDALLEAIRHAEDRFWLRRLSRTLLTDGTFDGVRPARRRLIEGIHDPVGVRLHAADARQSQYQPIAAEHGGGDLAEIMRAQIAVAPTDPIALDRARLLMLHDDVREVAAWWASQIAGSADGTAMEAWLKLGIVVQGGRALNEAAIDRLSAVASMAPAWLLAAGAVPGGGSEAERRMLRAVLDGQASELPAPYPSAAADLLNYLRPARMLSLARPISDETVQAANLAPAPLLPSALRGARHRLRQDEAQLVEATREARGQSGTTSVWINTGRALTARYGRCWLANEIALIGAAVPGLTTGGDLTPDALAFGAMADVGVLVSQVRQYRAQTAWWVQAVAKLQDDLDRAVWILALASCASETVVVELLDTLAEQVDQLSPEWVGVVTKASARIGLCESVRRLPQTVVESAIDRSIAMGALLVGFAAGRTTLVGVGVERARDIVALTAAGWPLVTEAAWTFTRSPEGEGSLPVLQAAGSEAELVTAPVPIIMGSLAGAILDRPGDYPWAVFAGANHGIEMSHNLTTLREVAAQQYWFQYSTV
jgi:hypothetical protein